MTRWKPATPALGKMFPAGHDSAKDLLGYGAEVAPKGTDPEADVFFCGEDPPRCKRLANHQ